MIKNAPALEIEDFGFCGYGYRVNIKGNKTFGYLSVERQDNWTFSYGETPSEASTSDPVSYEGYTLDEIKEELEFELTNFYIGFGANGCEYDD